jgi:hypothetical protein
MAGNVKKLDQLATNLFVRVKSAKWEQGND